MPTDAAPEGEGGGGGGLGGGDGGPARNIVISSLPVTAAVGQVRTAHEPCAILARLYGSLPPQVTGCVGHQRWRGGEFITLSRQKIAAGTASCPAHHPSVNVARGNHTHFAQAPLTMCWQHPE